VVLKRSDLPTRLVDRPNERSLHRDPTPRIGGLGLLAGALPVAIAAGSDEARLLAGLAGVVAIVSAMDDAASLPVSARLATHLVAAVLAVAIVGPATGVPAAALAALGIAWMANLYNFMDGADGLAGGMAAIGFAALAVAAAGAGDPGMALLAGALGAAAIAFLVFNYPPASLFMGDAGSVPLGLLAGAIGWHGVARGSWPAWFPLLVFSPFIVDATVTLLRRLVAREPVWKAHRSHYYQRLVLAGWSHRRLALAAWAVMAAAAASALAALGTSPVVQSAILAAWVLAYAAMGLVIDRRHPRGDTPGEAASSRTKPRNNKRAPRKAADRPAGRPDS
jgi:UDP-N-acetylmuramyl pentapeptide phosphotransferase/UDP-N-acetylglucosamine-1-phosphate transferase